jgi:hypothetical protein
MWPLCTTGVPPVIALPCVDVKDLAYVEECPVDCSQEAGAASTSIPTTTTPVSSPTSCPARTPHWPAAAGSLTVVVWPRSVLAMRGTRSPPRPPQQRHIMTSAATAVTFVRLGVVLGRRSSGRPGVDLRTGLAIGRLVFRALNTAEIVFAAALLTCVFTAAPAAWRHLHCWASSTMSPFLLRARRRGGGCPGEARRPARVRLARLVRRGRTANTCTRRRMAVPAATAVSAPPVLSSAILIPQLCGLATFAFTHTKVDTGL